MRGICREADRALREDGIISAVGWAKQSVPTIFTVIADGWWAQR